MRGDYQCGRRLDGWPPTFDSDYRRGIAQCHSQRDGGFSPRRSRELLVIAGDCGIVAPKIDVVGYSYISPKFIGNDPVLILPVEARPMSVEAMMPVEFVTTTQMGEKGQVTVPKRYRDALKLETGAPMAVLRLGAGLLLIPEQARFRQLCDRIAGAGRSRVAAADRSRSRCSSAAFSNAVKAGLAAD